MTFRDQVITLQNFKRGDTNCLFATPVAEEGIDVPDCDLVIRFDLYNSVIQYLQSKGRARQEHSRYISLVEDRNVKQLRVLSQATRDAAALRRFCTALPADRKLQEGTLDALAAARYEQIGQKVHEIPSTGARLTFPHSLGVLSRFVSSLNQGDTSCRAEYIVTSAGTKFISDVILPDSSPIKAVSGFPQRSKILAKCSAAFETCVMLIKKKYIDDHFQPVFLKKLPTMRNARLAVSSDKKENYKMLLRPKIWSALGDGIPTDLFATTIILDSPEALGRPSRPLILFSRKKLPDLLDIPLFFGNGQSSVARLFSCSESMKFTTEQVRGLAKFTLKVFEDVFSKEYDAKPEQLPYFLAPSTRNYDDVTLDTQAHVDWGAVDIVRDNASLAWENAPDEFFFDKFVTDPMDGSRKLITKGINKSLRPSDPTPEGVPERKSRGYRQVEQNIKEYSNSLFLKSRERAQWRDDQPVVNAELLSLRRNLLNEFQIDEKTKTECFIILEPLKVSPVSPPILYLEY